MDKPNISRRDILKVGGLVAAGTALSACTPTDDILSNFQLTKATTQTKSPSPTLTSPLKTQPSTSTIPGTVAPDESIKPSEDIIILHTLRRMQFGFTPQMLHHAQAVGLDNYLDEQLQTKGLDSSVIEERLKDLEIMKHSKEELFEYEKQGRLVSEFILSTIFQQVSNPYQIYEMMVDFWTNHFNIFLLDGFEKVLKIFDDNEVIRPNALGTFPELLQASAHSPAMLYYLDQARSTRKSPNENYARELLELHTVGVDGGYTQTDIETLARELTGWSIVSPRDVNRSSLEIGDFYFRNRAHDNQKKTIIGFQIPAGQGLSGGENFINFLASHPSTAQFIARKLAIRYISDSPPQSIIDKLVQSFTNTDGDIKSILRTLINSPEFIASSGIKFKRPLEFLVSMLIATNTKIEINPNTTRLLFQALQGLGQVPYFWQPPDGYPDYQSWWSTTSGMLNRWNIALILLTEQLPGIHVPLKEFVYDGSSPEDYVDLLSLQFLGKILPDTDRDILISYTSEGNLNEKIPYTAALILSSPHFQMR
jgi:uncharacterized protein (DUF1800 family)